MGDRSDRNLITDACCWISVFLGSPELFKLISADLPTMEGAAEDTVVDDTVVSRSIPSHSCSRLAMPRYAPCLARVSRARPQTLEIIFAHPPTLPPRSLVADREGHRAGDAR